MGVHSGHRERVRNRIREVGFGGAADHEVLEYILFHAIPYKDTNPIAHALMEHFGSFSAVLDAEPERLRAIEGMTDSAALLLSALPKICVKYQEKNEIARIKLRTLDSVKRYLVAKMGSLTREEIHVICKDSGANLIHSAVLSKGSVSEVSLFKRELIDMAIRHKATSIIIAHNHPSKVVQPSLADLKMTQEAAIALSMVNIIFDDHVIVGGNEIYSFRQNGMLDKLQNSEVRLTFKGGTLTDILL